jgi:hypothetical protein
MIGDDPGTGFGCGPSRSFHSIIRFTFDLPGILLLDLHDPGIRKPIMQEQSIPVE